MKRPETKEEIEQDLKVFLKGIAPIVEMAQGGGNLMLKLPLLIKRSNDPNFINWKELGELLTKYEYLTED